MYAGRSDFTASTQIRPIRLIPISRITITYRLDGVSQELNETFSIEFGNLDVNNSDLFPHPSEFPDIMIGHLNGTIIDRDSE